MNESPSLNPQSINDDNWYYENKGSIDIIHQVRDNKNKLIRTDEVRIPFSKLITTLRRCGYSVVRRKSK